MRNLTLNKEFFGELLPYIEDDSVTDINYSNGMLWLNDLNKGRYLAEGVVLSDVFLNTFSTRIANLNNVNFNKNDYLLEAETDELRITIVHEDVTNTGRSISIRKTPAVKRINRERMQNEDYCDMLLDQFMAAAVKAKCNIIIAGLPGAGKTEYLKYLTEYIPAQERVITVEDNLEIRYHQINPDKDCVELRVDGDFTYPKAIKCSLRNLAEWILLSESRSVEVKYLLEAMSTGASALTTIHTDDVRKIPDRIENMFLERNENARNDVYNFLDIGVHILAYTQEGKIKRRINQVCIFDRDDQGNQIHLIYNNGKFVSYELPENLRNKFAQRQVQNPFVGMTQIDE
ncbi:MAG TPA: ATPase, T2SS/T4P/T4SS family [Lachnospiraceae bacterium]|nr:ATPase, T2SS/T4P/T4SS family [Lachnospiraceae bacterium]